MSPASLVQQSYLLPTKVYSWRKRGRRRSVLGQYLVSLLYGITSYDPVTVGLVLMVLAFASSLAGRIPTVRAITINPITAPRE